MHIAFFQSTNLQTVAAKDRVARTEQGQQRRKDSPQKYWLQSTFCCKKGLFRTRPKGA